MTRRNVLKNLVSFSALIACGKGSIYADQGYGVCFRYSGVKTVVCDFCLHRVYLHRGKPGIVVVDAIKRRIIRVWND